MNDKQFYVMFDNLRIGKFEYLCTCEQCKERGDDEIIFVDLDDHPLRHIKKADLEDMIITGETIAYGESIEEVTNNGFASIQHQLQQKDRLTNILLSILDWYQKNTVEKSKELIRMEEEE